MSRLSCKLAPSRLLVNFSGWRFKTVMQSFRRDDGLMAFCVWVWEQGVWKEKTLSPIHSTRHLSITTVWKLPIFPFRESFGGRKLWVRKSAKSISRYTYTHTRAFRCTESGGGTMNGWMQLIDIATHSYCLFCNQNCGPRCGRWVRRLAVNPPCYQALYRRLTEE